MHIFDVEQRNSLQICNYVVLMLPEGEKLSLND